MPRLIDADALDDRLREEYLSASDVSMVLTPRGSIIFNAVLDRVRCIAISQPVIDADPVRRGWWIKKPTTIKYISHSECSLCGSWQGADWMNYCPHCGAKMDGGNENEG